MDADVNFQLYKLSGTSPPTSAAFPFTPVGGWLEGKAGEASRDFNGGLDLSGNNGDIFVSFLLRKNVNGGTSGDNVEVTLADGTNQVVRVGSTSDDKFFLGLAVGSGQAVVGGPLTIGQTYFVVLKGTASASGNDVFSAAFYDPAEIVPGTEPAAWDLTWGTSSSVILNTLRLAMGTNATGAFDEFRLGSTWADVAIAPLAGDFNSDGRVDAADYVVWRKGLGTTYTQDNYNAWRANFGATLEADGSSVGNGTAAVPEPAAWAVVIAGMCFCSLSSARKRSNWEFCNWRNV
jgi:hypothetical protein